MENVQRLLQACGRPGFVEEMLDQARAEREMLQPYLCARQYHPVILLYDGLVVDVSPCAQRYLPAGFEADPVRAVSGFWPLGRGYQVYLYHSQPRASARSCRPKGLLPAHRGGLRLRCPRWIREILRCEQ